MANKVTLELSTPLEGTSGPISKLELREPRFKDLKNCGMPINVTTGQIDWENSSTLLEAITGVPSPILEQMGVKDAMAAIGKMAEFFGEPEEVTEGK